MLDFKLIYRGPLHSASRGNPRTKEKHDIRKELHKQLKLFWKIVRPDRVIGSTFRIPTYSADVYARRFTRGRYRFLPIITQEFAFRVALDILFMRRDIPGKLITGGGDIDNRLKTLCDALRMPEEDDKILGGPQGGEDPFFILLQDDSLITDIKLTTSQLFTPPQTGEAEGENDVHLVIGVAITPTTLDLQSILGALS